MPQYDKKKEELHLHYFISGNFAEIAKSFGINKSTMREIIKAFPVPHNIKLLNKCNFPGARQPLTYPVELDDELLAWILAYGICISQYPFCTMADWDSMDHVVTHIRGRAFDFLLRLQKLD